MKFCVTGIEKIRDVVEADDIEMASKRFRAQYPAVFKIEEVEELNSEEKSLYPDCVAIGDENGTALRRQGKSHSYYRDAGAWGCKAKVVDGILQINEPSMSWLHKKPLIEIDLEKWRKDNEGYLDEYDRKRKTEA